MSEKSYEEKPHSPDIKERESLDDGFSSGWGFHFPPSEAYWLDSHNHLRKVDSHSDLYNLIDEWFAELDAFRLGKLIAIAGGEKSFKIYKDVSETDKRFEWIFSLSPQNPDPELLQSALDHGAIGLKLHNSSIMRGEVEADVWLSDEWLEVFEVVEDAGIPILWHVTQRMSASPYHGGNANSYWEGGQEKGIEVTNEDLLMTSLEVIKRFSDINLIGAHQLHVGLDRLSSLFEEYDNLYIDSSCGFVLRWADVLYEEDREVLRNFFLKYPDRILFGTDSPLSVDGVDEYLVQGFLLHPRFVLQLRLPDEILQKVAHGNAERLYGLESLEPTRRGTVRP